MYGLSSFGSLDGFSLGYLNIFSFSSYELPNLSRVFFWNILFSIVDFVSFCLDCIHRRCIKNWTEKGGLADIYVLFSVAKVKKGGGENEKRSERQTHTYALAVGMDLLVTVMVSFRRDEGTWFIMGVISTGGLVLIF